MGHSCVYRCDRCGAISEPAAGSGLPAAWCELSTLTEETEIGDDTFAADLCPACAGALQRWLQDVS